MAAHELLSSLQFYHGTDNHIRGDVIEPGHRGNYTETAPATWDAYHTHKYAYASTDPKEAYDHPYGDTPYSRVFRVSPIGIPVRDPEDTETHPTKFMSRQGWRIEPDDAASRAYSRRMHER